MSAEQPASGRLDIVILLTPDFRKPIGGYKVAYEYANRLAARGHRVRVVHISDFDTRPWARFARRLRHRRPKVRRTKVQWFRLHDEVEVLEYAAFDSGVYAGADAVIATAWQTAEALAAADLGDATGFYLLQHFEDWAGPAERVVATWRGPLVKIAIADWLVDKAIELGAGHTYKISNAIDLRVFGVDRAPEDRVAASVLMLWHELPFKGSALGVAALCSLRERQPGLRVTLFSGFNRPNGLPTWMDFVSRANEGELRALYNDHAIFVSPSRTEGWGLPPAEAMASGCALVTTPAGAAVEYAHEGATALLVPVDDAVAIVEAVDRLIHDDKLRCRLARAGAEFIQENFDWEDSANRLEAIMIQHAG